MLPPWRCHPGCMSKKWCHTIFEEECNYDDVHPGWMTETNKWCSAGLEEKCHHDDTTHTFFFLQTIGNICYADLFWSWTVQYINFGRPGDSTQRPIWMRDTNKLCQTIFEEECHQNDVHTNITFRQKEINMPCGLSLLALNSIVFSDNGKFMLCRLSFKALNSVVHHFDIYEWNKQITQQFTDLAEELHMFIQYLKHWKMSVWCWVSLLALNGGTGRLRWGKTADAF